MKKHHILLSISIFWMLASCSENADFYYANNTSGSYQAFSQKTLIINYWASWCKPCRDEIPELNKLAKNHPNINVIGINFDKIEGDALRQQISDFEIDFPVTTANFHLQFNFDYPQALPTTVIISPKGEVQQILIGPQTEQGLSQFIQ